MTFLYLIIKKINQFKNIANFKNKQDLIQISFIFNPFNNNFSSVGKYTIYAPAVNNFYLDAPLANASQTIAACALFLNQESNFTNEL
jgi:hypothetical protein